MTKLHEKYITAALSVVTLVGAGFAVHYSIQNNAALAQVAALDAEVQKLSESQAEKGLSNPSNDNNENSENKPADNNTDTNDSNAAGTEPSADRVEMSAFRKAADDALMTELCQTAFTWSTSAEYNSAREQMQTRFGLDPNGQFLSKFFIPLVRNEDVDNRNVNGSFVSLDSQLLSIDGDVYSYVGKVTTQSLDRNGAAAQDDLMIYYETNSDGSIKDLQGFLIQ